MGQDLTSILQSIKSRHPEHGKALGYALAEVGGLPKREKPPVVVRRYREDLLDLCVEEPEHAKTLVLAAELLLQGPGASKGAQA
jgi:hypothetical protein